MRDRGACYLQSFEEFLFVGLFLLWKILGELLDRLTAKQFDHGVNELFDEFHRAIKLVSR